MLSIHNRHSWNTLFKSTHGENCAMTKSQPHPPVPSDVGRYHLDIAFCHVQFPVPCDRATSNALYYPSEQRQKKKKKRDREMGKTKTAQSRKGGLWLATVRQEARGEQFYVDTMVLRSVKKPFSTKTCPMKMTSMATVSPIDQ